MKYNLTFWQRLELIPMFYLWLTTPHDERKSWHHVKKGMEKHTHKFTKPFKDGFLMCEHEGCNRCEPTENLFKP